MRVVSLLPSATELLFRLGAEPVGVSHSCDYPPAARDLPTLTSTTIDHGADRSAANDLRAREGWADLSAVSAGEVYAVDGNGYVNRPRPRLVDTLELFAACLRPERFDPPAPDAVRRVRATSRA